MNRYDKNTKLYDNVKKGDYDDYNNNVVDVEYDVELNMKRGEFQEKKRLSIYFEDIQKELSNAAMQLDNLTNNSDLEIKPDVDLRSLIEQAKRKNDDGVKIFSNTQHEILSKLDVEEVDENELELEDIVFEEEIDLEDKDEVSLTSDEKTDLEDEQEVTVEEISIGGIDDIDFDGAKEVENDNINSTLVIDKKEIILDKELEYKDPKVESEKKQKNSKLGNAVLTAILAILIVILIVIGFLVLKEFI